MLSFTLPDPDSVSAFATQIGDAGLELLPAAVAAVVLVALSAALVITARRGKGAEHEHAPADDPDESVYGRPVGADA